MFLTAFWSEPVGHCTTHTDIWNTCEQSEKRTQVTRGNPSWLDGVISTSLFPFVQFKWLLPPALRLYMLLSHSHSIHSWLWNWMNSKRVLGKWKWENPAFEDWSWWHLHARFSFTNFSLLSSFWSMR